MKEIEESLSSLVTAISTKNARGPASSEDSSKTVQKIERAPLQTSTNSWADITARNINLPIGWTRVEEQPKRNKASKSWRQRLGILRGTAISENDNESLSADVQLVAYGIAKNVTGIEKLVRYNTIRKLHLSGDCIL